MAVPLANGQGTKALSLPVVIASDQDALSVTPTASNANATLFASAERTTTATTADQTNSSYRGCIVVLDVTAIAATGSIVLTLQGKDAISGKYYTLITSAAVVTAVTTVYQVYPASTVAAINYNGPLPTTWRVVVTPTNSVAISYSVGVTLQG